jgi:hypothetical protein
VNGNRCTSGGGGGGSNAAAGPTGSAVPADGSYNALNVSGTLRGQTGTNTAGSTYAADTNVVALPAAAGPALPANSDSVVTSWQSLQAGVVTTAMALTASTQVIASVASNYLYIGTCTVSNASTTVSTDVNLQNGSGGATLWVIPAPAATVATTGGGGATISWNPPLKVTTIGTGLYAANVTTGSSVKISCSGSASTVSY